MYCNQLDRPALRNQLRHCCAAEKWVAAMMETVPIDSPEQLHSNAARIWLDLSEEDYLQAFDAHPKIGDPASLKKKYAATLSMATQEQSSVSVADESTLVVLAESNQRYEDKFGFIFIVCATGKSAAEMLSLLLARLPNDRKTELDLAAAEQLKITQIRLKQLVEISS